MRDKRHLRARFRPTVSLFLFGALMATLWFAGGGSRPDIAGQVIVRGVCWILLITYVIWGPLPKVEAGKPIAALLIVTTALVLFQMIPLPPAIWQALPGRELLSQAAIVSGQEQPWRPLSMVPGATANALSSLIVPFVTLIFYNGMVKEERALVPMALLAFIVAAGLVGLLQLTGVPLNNPLVNEGAGEVAGTFANRNHFALLLAIGCVLAPVWAVSRNSGQAWRVPVAIGLVLLFVMAILASGSRVGLVLGAAALFMTAVITGKQIKRALRMGPRWIFPLFIIGALGIVSLLTAASIISGRAASVDRMLTINLGQDMRGRGLPTVLEMIRHYFPWGSGLGGFDTLFRLHEPFNLLAPTYFNHAHNDWLEILLDAGLPGGLVLLGGTIWWVWASSVAWRGEAALAKLGSTILLFVMVASTFDYPARTPLIVAIMVIAGVWLSPANVRMHAVSPLPPKDQSL